MSNEKISLYFSEGSSDKEYHAELSEQGAGYVVTFRYGRRGSALASGSKTPAPLPLAKAKAIYDKLVKEKTAKGYSTGEAGNAYQSSELEARFTGVLPQLLNAVNDAELERLLRDDAYALQEKKDGKRVLLHRTLTGVQGANRRGLVIALPQAVADAALRLAPCVLDGELIGEVFFVFDLLELKGTDWRQESYFKRAMALKQALNVAKLLDEPSGALREVPMYVDRHKRAAYETILAAHGEGVVFKLMAAPYSSGRPASGGTQLKYKFVESASLRVSAQNSKGKRSVALELQDESGQWVGVGSVAIPANYSLLPAKGAIVEVEYLYAYKGGSLFQPVYKGLRDDLTMSACVLSQLKYKAESSEDEDA
jgi:bifunctional non-homologous end joining protein LigD